MSKFILSGFGDEIADDLKIQMNVMERLGIRYIEMRGVNGKPLVQHSLEEVRAIKKEMDSRGFKVSCVASPIGKIGVTDDFKPHVELFKHTLEIAKVLQTRYIRMFSFYIPQGQKPEKFRDEVMYRWKEFVAAAEGTGLVLLHENEKGIYGDTPERCHDIVNTMKCDYVRSIFDPANFVQCNVTNYPHAYGILKDSIEYLHIKDAVYSDHHVVPAGEGDGKVKEILTELYKSNFEGFVSLEPHLGAFTGLAQLEANMNIDSLAEGGDKTFAIAVQALKKILCEIEKSYDINKGEG